ncbi:hypothetical protein BT93_L2841 [Corymbia citriodora subsp. variegata]|uniref:Uncharacterized protein n=1 Tax=Corymbia citriodora subsp. variegata TaxID=360336 RepID=A0A8T0CNB6_CORYI|nr:hypothetical protein BT93_L2841 [Corymbia citriodora subsp. variegata]
MCEGVSGQLICSVKPDMERTRTKVDTEISENERKTKLGSPKRAVINVSAESG